MKILSLNTWGGTLFDELIAYLSQTDADVLCLQEIIHSPTTDIDMLTYRDGDHVLPQRANLFRDIASVLPDHTAIFYPSAQGVLWDGDTALPSQWGLATFVSKRLPIVAQMQGFVHKTYSSHSYGDHPRSRNAHAIRLYDYDKNQPICVAHMHGLRDLRGKIDTPERAEQAHKLLTIVNSVAEPNDAIVVCGDFNVEPASETLQILAKDGFTELVTSHNIAGTRTSHYKKSGRYADYMLINDAVTVAAFEVVNQPEVSDHCPLILEI